MESNHSPKIKEFANGVIRRLDPQFAVAKFQLSTRAGHLFELISSGDRIQSTGDMIGIDLNPANSEELDEYPEPLRLPGSYVMPEGGNSVEGLIGACVFDCEEEE